MSDLTPVPPKSIWHRPIVVDFRKLFAAVGRIAVDAGSGSWVGTIKDGIGLADSLGLGQSPEEVAGLLIARALTRTVVELIEPYRRDFPNEHGEFTTEVEEFLASREYALDERFLEQPGALKIVSDFAGRVHRVVETCQHARPRGRNNRGARAGTVCLCTAS